MKSKLFYISIWSLLFGSGSALSSSAQEQKQALSETNKIKKENILDLTLNQNDGQAKKNGFWIEENGLKEVYYLHGKKNGVYKSYFKKTKKLEKMIYQKGFGTILMKQVVYS